jgi:hypothetical protein
VPSAPPESFAKQAKGHELKLSKLPLEHRRLFEEADAKEWQSWLDTQAIRLLSPEEERKVLATVSKDDILPSRVVRVNKNHGKPNEPFVAKSRICVQGFHDADFTTRTDSPTLSQLGSHVLLTVGTSLKFRLGSADVSTAFLQGNALDRQVYLRLPHDLLIPGIRKGAVVLALKGVYGLREAPRKWYLRFSAEMQKLGCVPCRLDPTLFTLRDKSGKLQGLIGCHVDDLLIMASDSGWHTIEQLGKIFPIKVWEKDAVTFRGRRLTQDSHTRAVTLDMADYTAQLKTISLPEQRKKQLEDPCTAEESKAFRAMMGSLSWLSNMGRPDLAFGTSRLQGYVSAPQVSHILDGNSLCA